MSKVADELLPDFDRVILGSHLQRAFRELTYPVQDRFRSTEDRFSEAATAWENNTAHVSSAHDLYSHPQYRRILALGNEVVPLILRRLEAGQTKWFKALEEITGENPVRREDEGRGAAIRRAWLEWAKAHDVQW